MYEERAHLFGGRLLGTLLSGMASRVCSPPRLETGDGTEYMEYPPTYNLIYTDGPTGIKCTSEHRQPQTLTSLSSVTNQSLIG